MRLRGLCLLLLPAIGLTGPATAGEKGAGEKGAVTGKATTAVMVTLDVTIIGGSAPVNVMINTDSILRTLKTAGFGTVGAVAKADLKALSAALAQSGDHKVGDQKGTLAKIHPKASIDLAARLKATAESVVMSGGSTMFTGLKGDSAFDAATAGRMFLNPSRTYKQLPDKYNMK